MRQGQALFMITGSDLYCTRPHNMTLSPWPERDLEVVDDTHPWCLTRPLKLDIDGVTYTNLAEVCMAAKDRSDPEEFVRKCLGQLPVHRPE